MKSLCYNDKTKYTVPYQKRVGGAFVYVCETCKEVALKILNKGRVYILHCDSMRYNGVAV